MTPTSASPDERSEEAGATGRKRYALVVLKLAVVAAVVWFVGQTASDAWRKLAEERITVRPLYGLASGAVFLASMAPMAWFWRRTLVALEQPAPWGPSFRAFYISQLGKYVPGKASVVLIRTERLLNAVRREAVESEATPSTRVVAASVFYETLTHMAVGALLAAGLTAALTPGDAASQRGWIALSVGLAVLCLTPTLPPVFDWLLRRAGERRTDPARALKRRLTLALAAQGAMASLVGWSLAGMSVGLAAFSVGVTPSTGVAPGALWVLAAALPVVAGFVSLLPAGVLVREGLTLGLLAPALGDGPALATTLAVRLIWVVSEVVLCGSLLGGDWLVGRRPDSTFSDSARKR